MSKQRDVLIAAAASMQYATIDSVAVIASCSASVARKWLEWSRMNNLFRGAGAHPRMYLPYPSFVGEFLARDVDPTAQEAFAKCDDIELWHYMQHAESIATGLVEWGHSSKLHVDRWLKRWEMARDELTRRDTERARAA